jgi:hypothetical protein
VPQGYALPRGEQSIGVPDYHVSDGYFATMGVPMLRGREFRGTDRADTPRVAVVNEQFVNHYWPKQDAIGKQFHIGTASGPLVEIVGIVKTAKYFWIAEPPMEFVYLPFTQDDRRSMTIVVESQAPDAATVAPVLRQVVRLIDPEMPVFDSRTMDNYYSQRAVKTTALLTQSVAGLGVMGLILTMVGLYGLIAYSVSRRQREIGIRMAVGANRMQVIRMVLKEGLRLGAIGVGAGLAVSVFACRAIISVAWVASFSHLNYGLFPAIAIPLLAITVLAAFAPARRASRVNPMRALRDE